jgi:tRNA 2-thiouridine synthesizing protein B
MPTLHTVNKSPFERGSMASCFAHLVEGDAILLIEDGVVGARKGTAFAATLQQKRAGCAIYVLGPDLAARGMAPQDLVEGIEIVDYGGFVELATQNARVCTWL